MKIPSPLAALLLLFTFSQSAKADDQGYLLSFIPSTCCVTNQCCWSVSDNEVKDLGDFEYEIKSTGQKVSKPKVMMSPDQKFYRCACDYDTTTQSWNKHQGANTRCLFVPNRGF